MRRLTLACLLLSTLVPLPARADDWADNPDPAYRASERLCREAKATPLPAAPVGSAAKDCDSDALLYGLGRPADPVAARLCALREMKDGDEGLRGAGTLATIYADGRGVPRDYAVALRYACLVDGAPAEMDGRVKHLASLRAAAAAGKPPPATPFDLCDDVTSGAMGGACAERAATLADAARAEALDAIERRLDPAGRAALARLEAAEAAFAKASSDDEVDTSGTGRLGFILASQQGHADAFLADLRAVLGEAPLGAGGTDKALNATYAKVMAQKDEDYPGAVKRAGVKATQRLWLAYRDGFLAFAKAVGSPVTPEALAARLTGERTRDLAALLPS